MRELLICSVIFATSSAATTEPRHLSATSQKHGNSFSPQDRFSGFGQGQTSQEYLPTNSYMSPGGSGWDSMAGLDGRNGYSKSQGGGMPYNFHYDVNDNYGNSYSHEENSDGVQTRGAYRVLLPDGRTQMVTYSADDTTGFLADVKYQGDANHKDGSSGPQSSGYRSSNQDGGYGQSAHNLNVADVNYKGEAKHLSPGYVNPGGIVHGSPTPDGYGSSNQDHGYSQTGHSLNAADVNYNGEARHPSTGYVSPGSNVYDSPNPDGYGPSNQDHGYGQKGHSLNAANVNYNEEERHPSTGYVNHGINVDGSTTPDGFGQTGYNPITGTAGRNRGYGRTNNVGHDQVNHGQDARIADYQPSINGQGEERYRQVVGEVGYNEPSIEGHLKGTYGEKNVAGRYNQGGGNDYPQIDLGQGYGQTGRSLEYPTDAGHEQASSQVLSGDGSDYIPNTEEQEGAVDLYKQHGTSGAYAPSVDNVDNTVKGPVTGFATTTIQVASLDGEYQPTNDQDYERNSQTETPDSAESWQPETTSKYEADVVYLDGADNSNRDSTPVYSYARGRKEQASHSGLGTSAGYVEDSVAVENAVPAQYNSLESTKKRQTNEETKARRSKTSHRRSSAKNSKKQSVQS